MMKQKRELIRDAWQSGDKIEALRIAARFQGREPELQIIKRGWNALSNRSFYEQLGKSPDALALAAYETMRVKFSLSS